MMIFFKDTICKKKVAPVFKMNLFIKADTVKFAQIKR